MTPLLALQSHYLTGRLRLKSSSKCLLIDLDTPLSPRNIRGLVLESFIDRSQKRSLAFRNVKCEFAEL